MATNVENLQALDALPAVARPACNAPKEKFKLVN